MEFVRCDLCGQDDTAIVEQSQSLDDNSLLTNVICKHCTLVYLNPRRSAEGVRKLYDTSEYSKIFTGYAGPVIGTKLSNRDRQILGFLEGRVAQGMTVMEVGCAGGALLAAVRDRFHANVIGLEPSRPHQRYAEYVHEIPVINGTLEAIESLDVKPDLVIMSHCLEHFISPRSALLKLRQMIQETGLVYIQVPNLFAHKCFHLAHLYSFHVASLKAIIESSLFQTEEIFTHGHLGKAWPRFFISAWARPASDVSTVVPQITWKSVILKRRLHRTLVTIPHLPRRSRTFAGYLARQVARRAVGLQRYAAIKKWYLGG